MKKWFYKNKSFNEELAKKFGVHPAIIKILADRGITEEKDVEEYLYPDLNKIPSGEELTDMKKAVGIMHDCIKQKKRIRVMGDYDVDGASSTYILYQGITHLGGTCDTFIPHRIEDGYGLHESAIRKAYEDGVEVIITCDNGIAAANEIALAKELGMTVIVTDHHEIPYKEENGEKKYIIPPADAVVDPKRNKNCFQEICGAMVSYKFIGCLYRKFGKEEDFINSDLLEFAALATVCDVMELLHENRTIVKAGLEKFPNTKNVGLQALLTVLDLKDKPIKGYDFGFRIGPCINAEGRLDSANAALSLFLETNMENALKMAEDMKKLNEKRQDLTKEGMEQAFEMVDRDMQNDKVLVVFLPELHESIAGIVAGKVRERYNKPTFVLTRNEKGFLKGSGRSIECYSMYEEMVKCADLMLGFGGHPLAAGLSLEEKNLEEFRKQMNENCSLTDADFIPREYIDVILPVEFLSKEFVHQLDILEPFGKGNEKPVFVQKHVKAESAEIIGKNKNVLKLQLPYWNCKDAIAFNNCDDLESEVKEKMSDFNMLYYPSINVWNNRERVQVIINDIC